MQNKCYIITNKTRHKIQSFRHLISTYLNLFIYMHASTDRPNDSVAIRRKALLCYHRNCNIRSSFGCLAIKSYLYHNKKTVVINSHITFPNFSNIFYCTTPCFGTLCFKVEEKYYSKVRNILSSFELSRFTFRFIISLQVMNPYFLSLASNYPLLHMIIHIDLYQFIKVNSILNSPIVPYTSEL